MEAERKKAFLMYCDYKQHLELLSDEERGKLFIALFDYAESKKTPQLSGMAAMAFSFIKAQMDRDNVKYEERCAINRENGAKGGRPRKSQESEQQEENPTKPKITERFSGKPKKPDTDNDTENETDNGTGNDTNHAGGSQSRSSVKVDSHSDELFNTFWEAYPNKKAKQSALKAWKKVKPNAALFEKIMKAIELQKRGEDWQRESGRFIPHPATWLNAGRWDDEIKIKEVSNNGEAGQRSDSGGIVSPDFQSRKSGSGTPAGFKSE